MRELSKTMVEFWDEGEHQRDHEAFKMWQPNNKYGFALNYPPDDLRIFHKLGCPHIRDHSNPNVSLTEHRKVCSTDKDELIELAGQVRLDWRPCETCSKKSHRDLWF